MISVSRRELKYLISYSNSIRLQEELGQLLQLDKHSKDGYYCVRSLYFDSYNNKDFTEKIAGIENRRKIRLRIYSTAQSKAKFEIKEKFGAYQKKDSLIVDKEDAKCFIQGDYSRLLNYNEEIATRLYSLLILGAYKPAVIVEYERRAYTYGEFNTRITFDRNVKSTEAYFDIYSDELTFMPVFADKVILEVKYNGALIEPIKAILAKYSLTNISVSKYCVGRPIMQHYII